MSSVEWHGQFELVAPKVFCVRRRPMHMGDWRVLASDELL